MAPMSTSPRNNVRTRDGTTTTTTITGSSMSTLNRRDVDNGDDNNNNNNNYYDYTTANRNDTAVPTGLRRRKNVTRRNNVDSDDDDNDNDDRDHHNNFIAPPKVVSGRFAPSLYPFVHVNEVVPADADKNYNDGGRGRGGFSTPPRSPSPKSTTKSGSGSGNNSNNNSNNNNNNRRTKVLAFPGPPPLSPGDAESGGSSSSFYGGGGGGGGGGDNNNDEKEIDYNEFHREKPKLKNPFSSQVQGGTESTANLNSSRTTISAELNIDYNDDCSITNIDKQLDSNIDEEEGYKNNDNNNNNSEDGDNDSNSSNNNNGDTNDNGKSTALTTAKSVFAKFQRSRHYVGSLVNNEFVQLAIILLIISNAIMMGLATMDWVTGNTNVTYIFEKIDEGFLIIFTLEIAMQLYYFGIALFQDGWLLFDLVIVIISWAALDTLQVVRAFRIFRAFRLVTRVKPLRDLILAIGQVLPRMYAIGFLLIIIFYVFAVLFTELFSTLELSENYFKTLHSSLFTCMQMMTLEWGDVTREVMEKGDKWWAWIPFVTYIAIAGFIVFNLVVAVVVEAVAATEETVRVLDGIESNNPIDKLNEAQERIDLLQHHLDNMMIEQEHIQAMLEAMAGEFLNLASERMKAEHRESQLRDEINKRIDYQKKMESEQKEQFQQQNQNQQQQQDQEPQASLTDRERKESERKEKVEDMYQSLSSSISLHGQSIPGDEITRTPRTRRKKTVIFSDNSKPVMTRANSSKSSTSSDKSVDMNASCPHDGFVKNSPLPDGITLSAPTYRKKLDLNNARYSTTSSSAVVAAAAAAAQGGQNGKESVNKARASWKAMLAIKQL